MKIDKLFAGFHVSALGLSAQRKRMNAIANNIANAETTRTDEGGPYRRQMVSVQSASHQTFVETFQGAFPSIPLMGTENAHMTAPGLQFSALEDLPGAVEAQTADDVSEFKVIHDPTHPDADEQGYVKMPNVNIVTEMVDMMSASRAYEANITVINAQKQMAKDSLEI